jgi:hypothetical protein
LQSRKKEAYTIILMIHPGRRGLDPIFKNSDGVWDLETY